MIEFVNALGEAKKLLESQPPDFMFRAFGAMALNALIQQALAEGVPQSFVDRFPALTPAQAKELYEAALRAALGRKDGKQPAPAT